MCSSSLTGEGVCDCVPAVRRHTKGYYFYTDTDSGDVTARFLKFLWIPLDSLAKLKKNSGVASRKRSRWNLILFVRFVEIVRDVPRISRSSKAISIEHVVGTLALAAPLLFVDAAAAKSSSKHGT